MGIRIAQGPEGGPEAIAGAIAPLVTRPGSTLESGTAPEVEGTTELQLAAPHRVFVTGLAAVAAGRLLAAARPQVWRYLVIRGDEVVASATVRDPGTGEVVFSHLTRGPYVTATVDAIEVAERAAGGSGPDYELRLLDVPALHLRAIWLHAETRDLLVPLSPAPHAIEPKRVYSEEELLPVLQPMALRVLAQAPDAGG